MPVQPDEVTDTLLYAKKDAYITEDSSVSVLNNKRLHLYGSVWLNGLPLSANEGGGGQVLSVNDEIGYVTITADDIDTNSGDTVEQNLNTLEVAVSNMATKSTSIITVAPLTGGHTIASDITLDINTFTAVTKGAVPPPISVTGKYLRDDGTWQDSGGGTGTVSTNDRILGRVTAGAGPVEEIVCTGAARLFLDDANSTTQRATLGLNNVNNTTDANKPVSTAQQAAIDLKADKTVTISTTAPLTGGGDLSASRTIDLSNFTSTVKGAVPPPVTVTGKFLRDDGTWVLPATPVTDGNKGDITVGSSGTDWQINALAVDNAEIAANATTVSKIANANVTNAKLANAVANTFKGNNTGSTAAPVDMTVAQAKTLLALTKTDVGLGNVDNTSDANAPVSTAQQTAIDLKADKVTTITPTAPLTGGGSLSANRTLDINTFTTSVKGAVPPPTVVAGKYLKDDGTWADPPGGGAGITTEDAVDATASALAAGTHTNVTVTYNDAANSISLAATGGTSFTTEDAVDAVAAALTAGNNIDIAYNDVANTITIDVEPLVTADISGLDTALSTKQPLDTDLTTIAGLTATTDNVIQSVSNAWASRTPAQLKTSLALTKADVGLGNVDNVSDANAPVSTAQQTALNLKADKTVTITGTGALSGGGDLSANRTLDVANDGITNAKLANMAANSIKGNNTGSAADPIDMTVAQTKTLLALTKTDVGLGNVDNTSDANAPVSTAQQTALNLKADKTVAINTTAPLTGGGDISANRTLDISTFTATVKGAVPPPTTATGKYLKDDGTWAVPASGMSDGDKGDITVGGTGTTLTIDTAAVTNAKMADMNQNTIKGRLSTQGVPQDLTITQTKTLLGLGQVDNTSDANKPVSTAQAAADALKAPLAQAVDTLNVGTYTVVAGDSGKIKRLGQACTITLPDTGLGVGERVDFTCTAGIATFVLGSGAGWDVTPTPSAVARSLGSVVTAIRMWPTAWLLTGDLA